MPKARLEPPAVRAIARERVDRRLDRAWEVPLTIVVGPAGAGKTTAVSHLVQRSTSPVVWYRAHPVDADATVLGQHLGEAIAHGTGAPCESRDLADLAVHFERRDGASMVVIDEFDAVIGTDAERALAASIEDFPPTLHLVTLSRHRPSFNVARLRLADGICEVGPNDLRFRSWEVDRLFRELYGRPLPPDEVAELERRTGGWVAALQLFNLATARLPAFERRAAIAHVGRRAGPDWDFLAENVLSGLPDELQRFLLDTVPFERLTAELCDDVREAHDSWQLLAELERLQLVTSSMEEPGSFRQHEVLRAHVEGLLREREGADAVHKRYRIAGETLERGGRFAEGLLSYCRGEDWTSVGRLLGARGAEVADRPGSWLASLPASIVQSDPWLLLAMARQQRADGRVTQAIATFEHVERRALTAAPAAVARRERLLLASLVDRSSRPSLAWVGALRETALGDPAAAAASVPGRTAHELLAVGVARLVAGDVRSASESLRGAIERSDASPTVALAAGVAALIADHLAGEATLAAGDDLEHAAATLDVPFLSRLARAAAAMVAGSLDQIQEVRDDCDRAGDAFGGVLAAVLGAISLGWRGAPPAAGGSWIEDARVRCEQLGVPTLHVWMLVLGALADAPDAAAAESVARRRGTRALQDLARVAAARAGREPGDHVGLAERLSTDHGLVLPTGAAGDVARAAAVPSSEPVLQLRCLGAFEVAAAGNPVDLSALRPRARTVLRMLAAHVGRGVHRQTMYVELWPDDDEASGAKKLHVAISSIRRALDAAGVGDVVERRGDLYLLAPDRVDCDVVRFTAAVAAGRTALAAGDVATARRELLTALDVYQGTLLPEDGTAEWVLRERQVLEADATASVIALAELLLDGGASGDAVGVCRAGLRIDRYCDPLWRLLLRALRLEEDHAGHARASAEYDAMLAELGVPRD